MAEPEFPAELASVLAGLHRLVRRTLRQGLSGPRLRGAEVELLRLAGETPGIRVSAAARELRLAGNSVSTLVNQLVGKGLLERRPDPTDGRAAQLLATPEAERRLRLWEDRRTALVSEQLARLAPEDREALAAALPALHHLATALHQDLEAP